MTPTDRAWRLAPVVLGTVVLHTAVLPRVRPLDVGADGLLLLAGAVGVVAGRRAGGWIGFGAGLLADCFLATPFGLSALVDGVAGWTAGAVADRFLRPGWEAAAITGAVSAAAVVLFVVAGTVLGERTPPTARLVTVLVVVGVLHAVLAPPALAAARWAVGEPADRRPFLEPAA